MSLDRAAAATALAREAGLSLERPLLGAVKLRAIAVGWATVEIDRATREVLAPGLGADEADRVDRADRADRAESLADDPVIDELLGARARILGRSALSIVLLEPTTEGRLAAALARRGEGPTVLYLAPVEGALRPALGQLAAAGIQTRRGRGPFGEAALVLGRPAAGPQLILVAVPSGA